MAPDRVNDKLHYPQLDVGQRMESSVPRMLVMPFGYYLVDSQTFRLPAILWTQRRSETAEHLQFSSQPERLRIDEQTVEIEDRGRDQKRIPPIRMNSVLPSLRNHLACA